MPRHLLSLFVLVAFAAGCRAEPSPDPDPDTAVEDTDTDTDTDTDVEDTDTDVEDTDTEDTDTGVEDTDTEDTDTEDTDTGVEPDPTCEDGVHNGDETDADCGGSCDATCDDGLGCEAADDCASGVCGDDGTCAEATCEDGVHNGDESDEDCGGSCDACAVGGACDIDADCERSVCDDASTCSYPGTCNDLHVAHPSLGDGAYAIDPESSGASFDAWCDMTTEGGGWTSIVHLTTLDRLNMKLPHTEVALSSGTSFWFIEERPRNTYQVADYTGLPGSNYSSSGDTIADTGWLWNGVQWLNPAPCHFGQNVYLVQTSSTHPRSFGNPHYNGGLSMNASVAAAAKSTASTIDVAAVANYPAIHIGCVGYNVLKDPIVWLR